MKPLQQMQSELTLIMGEVTEICRRHKYAATPTLLLRHKDGASKSVLLSNDSLGKVVLCIAELGQVGDESDMSPSEAMLKLFAAEAIEAAGRKPNG